MLNASDSDICSLIHEGHRPWSIPLAIRCIAMIRRIDGQWERGIDRDFGRASRDIRVGERPPSTVSNSDWEHAIAGKRVRNAAIQREVNRRRLRGGLSLAEHWNHARMKTEEQCNPRRTMSNEKLSSFLSFSLFQILRLYQITLDDRLIIDGWFSNIVLRSLMCDVRNQDNSRLSEERRQGERDGQIQGKRGVLTALINAHKSYHHCRWSLAVVVYFLSDKLHTVERVRLIGPERHQQKRFVQEQITWMSRIGKQLARFFESWIVLLSISQSNAAGNDQTVSVSIAFRSFVIFRVSADGISDGFGLLWLPINVFSCLLTFFLLACLILLLLAASYISWANRAY